MAPRSERVVDRRIELCRVLLSDKLVDAMLALDRSNVQIALVVDENEHMVGTMTDGDIRRALLSGADLQSPILPHIVRNFASVGPSAGRAEVLELMQARSIQQIPVLDDERRLVGLHLIHELLGIVERPNWALIMAGGLGTRLRPLTETVPKPMIKVAGRPILERLVLHLVGFGVRRIFLAVNYLSEIIEQHFGAGELYGCEIEYLREDQPLGTGGALALLPDAPTHPLLCMNGDLMTQFDVGALLDFHDRGRYAATVAVHPYMHTVPFGVVEIDAGRLVKLQEKPTMVWSTNAGIYVLNPQLPLRVPHGKNFPITGLVEDCLVRQERVGAYLLEGDWIDVGRASELDRARGKGE